MLSMVARKEIDVATYPRFHSDQHIAKGVRSLFRSTFSRKTSVGIDTCLVNLGRSTFYVLNRVTVTNLFKISCLSVFIFGA